VRPFAYFVHSEPSPLLFAAWECFLFSCWITLPLFHGRRNGVADGLRGTIKALTRLTIHTQQPAWLVEPLHTSHWDPITRLKTNSVLLTNCCCSGIRMKEDRIRKQLIAIKVVLGFGIADWHPDKRKKRYPLSCTHVLIAEAHIQKNRFSCLSPVRCWRFSVEGVAVFSRTSLDFPPI
jgi:hypothetical protein